LNLVLTRSAAAPFAGMQAVGSLAQARELAAGAELMVIGGGEIYALALPMAERMYLTHVEATVADADAFFPAFDPGQWRVVERQRHGADDRHAHAFEFVDYQRRPAGPG
jgi:dihydrofolate reductase